MREILFRAKKKNWRELPKEEWWVEGYPVKYQPCASKNEYVYGICPTYASALYIMEIDLETLCQYTRLKDKNGNRIWENDIVSCEHEKYPEDNPLEVLPFSDPIKYKRNYSVEFINTGSSYGYRLRNKSIHFMLTGNVVYNHKIEVIGNIFDDKHLLSETDYYREQEKETED